MIGAIGSRSLDDVIMFEVSPDKILTINNFIRRSSVRFADNDVLLKKPISQFVGPALDVINFNIILWAQLGVNPQAEFDKLISVQRDGETVSIIIGKTAFGVGRWRIESLGVPWDVIDDTGFCVSSTVSIGLKEYV